MKELLFGGLLSGLLVLGLQLLIQEQEKIPKLKMLSYRTGDNGVILTLENLSTSKSAAITGLSYYVFDPQILEQIAKVDPRPRPLDAQLFGANELDEPVFSWGRWLASTNCYVFSTEVGYHVDAGGVSDIEPKLKNCNWAGQRFVGSLDIYYNNGDKPLRIDRVTIDAQPCH